MSGGKYPGWRTMTAAQRYNARMHAIFETARKRPWALSGIQDGERVFWNKDDGWGDVNSATRFNPQPDWLIPLSDAVTDQKWVQVHV